MDARCTPAAQEMPIVGTALDRHGLFGAETGAHDVVGGRGCWGVHGRSLWFRLIRAVIASVASLGEAMTGRSSHSSFERASEHKTRRESGSDEQNPKSVTSDVDGIPASQRVGFARHKNHSSSLISLRCASMPCLLWNPGRREPAGISDDLSVGFALYCMKERRLASCFSGVKI